MRTESLKLAGESAESVLNELASYALERGYVEEPYVDALVEREREHPTGLAIDRDTHSFGVAIPHADPDYVTEQAVIVGFPKDTATFRSMDDPDREIPVDAVLLFLVTETEGYSSFLSNMVKLFQDDEFAERVLAKDADAVTDMIVERAVDLD